jgi:Flp pilus assembly protein TadG
VARVRRSVGPPRDGGAALVLVVLVSVALAAAVLLALVPVLVELTHRQQAQSAADAAALAGVTGGRAAADRLAVANGATIIAWSQRVTGLGVTVTVTVSVGGQQATARATDEP